MVYDREEVAGKYEFLTYLEFIEKYHPMLTKPSIRYAANNDLLDIMRIGNQNYVVLTQKSLDYSPNKSKKRDIKLVTQ